MTFPVTRYPLYSATFLATLLAFCFAPLLAQVSPESKLLTTAAQIRALTPDEAAQQIPIRLQGCFLSRENNAFSMQDHTDGLFVFAEPGVALDFQPGDLIEVEGVSNPGDYAPCASATSVRRIGSTQIPDPIQTTISELHSGQKDVAWVEVTGIVRSAEIAPTPDYLSNSSEQSTPRSYTKLKLADGNSHLLVEMREAIDPNELLDAKIRLRGHCFYLHNGNRQFLRPILHTPVGVKPEILVPPLHIDFDGSPTPVSKLLTFDPTGGRPGHRIHVRGIVTHHQPGKAFWIRDQDQSLQVQSTQLEELNPGDLVDVLGFPESGTYSPVLQDAVFKKAGTQAPPVPATLDEILSITRHDSDLVSLEAELLEIQRYPESIELTLQALDTTVRASLLLNELSSPPPNWRPGSIVSLSGIATVGEGETVPLNGLWWAESLHILLRSPADLAVIQQAPWWTPKRVAYTLAVILSIALLTIAVIVLLSRHRLREQKQHRAMAESEFTAILNERNRVAREIHDTLAQNIGAISVQLEMVRTDSHNLGETTQRHIQTAHKLARTALSDARDTIWNMRSQVLEQRDLSGALERIGKQLTEDTDITVSTRITGGRRRLAPVVENNLLRVGQEAITNACKHAQPKHINVEIRFQERRVELSVEDDGIGFDKEKVDNETKRSFGLVGIQERIELLDGEVTIETALGQGTHIVASVSD
ncbi:sensor histidine kinase [Pelagicoccus mobilis]|uniref:Sensor histidine kinase n=1 Tax=Pelagicoccus mobilis TaxID=415221 RepID=A0A934S1N8_9BACT|nr:sensor histidine kinase [Pelagicoccus mobilis]MBK1877809.1 sensor histidine kinase [Pelagicoccus mobilis]